MNVENTETNNEIFDQSATRLKGIKNLMTPSGDVMRVTDTDIKWFNHFYTFKVQGKKCYQSIGTIAKVMGRARSVAQERINNLESLGLLTVGKEAFNEGWRNTYTCTPIDDIVSRMTDAKVTPQDKKLKKSQLDSLLRKSEAVDALAINQGIKAMAKTITGREISDEEVMQFTFQITAEKLAVLGWNIETTAKKDGKSDIEATEPQAEPAATPAAAPETTSQRQPTSATILDLIDEILNSYEYERDQEFTFGAVKEMVEDEIKRSSHYDDPAKYTKRKETLAALGRFDIQVQHVMARLAEMALEQRGLDVPVKTAIAEYLQEYQEEQEYLEEQKQNEATATEVQPEAVTTPSADAPTDEPANQPTDTPAGQNPDLAPEPAPDDSGQRDSVASNDDGSSDAGTDGNNAVNQAEEQEDHFPWKGDTFIKNRLSENAYKWALTAGATDWHHACRLVWEKVEVTPPTEIDEHFKPLSLC